MRYIKTYLYLPLYRHCLNFEIPKWNVHDDVRHNLCSDKRIPSPGDNIRTHPSLVSRALKFPNSFNICSNTVNIEQESNKTASNT